MCAMNHSTPEDTETQSENVGERLRTALKAIEYWPSEVTWTREGVFAWLKEELELLNPLHLHVVLHVVTGLRVLELADHVEYVKETLEDVGHGEEGAEILRSEDSAQNDGEK